jgi:streptogrisin D
VLHALRIGVDLQVEGREQTLIDRHGGDAGWGGSAHTAGAVPEAAPAGASAEGPADAAAAEASREAAVAGDAAVGGGGDAAAAGLGPAGRGAAEDAATTVRSTSHGAFVWDRSV